MFNNSLKLLLALLALAALVGCSSEPPALTPEQAASEPPPGEPTGAPAGAKMPQAPP